MTSTDQFERSLVSIILSCTGPSLQHDDSEACQFMYIYILVTYILGMPTEIPLTEARYRFSEVIETSARQPVFLTKHGRRLAVVLSPAEYERLLEAAEDAEDLAAFDAAMAEIIAGAPTIPWAQVKADLGLV
jgi:antitoxin Phd